MDNKIPLILLLIFSLSGHAAEQPAVATATFAGGCFWCMEPPFDKLSGVIETISGYTGGNIDNPTYELVSGGKSGHYEALQVLYDPKKIGYRQLLEVFWKNIDPTDGRGQFCDKGRQYRSAIFYHDDRQRQLAVESKNRLQQNNRLSGPIETAILPASTFYPAETYHQNYYRKNPLSYKFYRYTCGRDKRLKKLWGESGR